ncbi:GNAT family N-acetyltransferase [Hymenobacter sp. HMF4947]|uniref:GNAT family N-acetyltransferase n=1 Tax=Hymenobacter ginkgonis TaxID=2682976 RepID=A0A7K1TCK9_9BACT|nr:GNAT family protein [Hymenobacter ginkgonis]MVN76115.1 GNAT family N-acetyltransferase [Hymenobacter ginkgonis]
MSFDFNQHLVLQNSLVRLRPLETTDFEPLKAVAFDPAIWQFTITRADDAVSLAAYLAAAMHERQAGKRYPFAIVERATGKLVGSTSYYSIVPEDQRLSIGYTWLGTAFQRTGLNRAAKHLLLSYAFETLQYERVELETDSRNLKSQQAMRRMGATEEGTLRRHRLTQGGYRRDTVIFSIIRPEWDALQQSVFKEYDARG